MAKIPPPPRFTGPEWEDFNRWLLELTSILSSSGGIDPTQIPGYPALQGQVSQNTSDITNLQNSTGGNSAAIGTLQGQVNSLTTRMGNAESNITTLQARAQVYNGTSDPAAGFGNVGDWFANTAGAAGHRIFVKTGTATWTAFPF